jgi:hypothetical protein
MAASNRTCSIEGCDKPVNARGWCKKHYTRWSRNGDPLDSGSRIVGDVLARYEASVERTPGCWYWVGKIGQNGYGYLNEGHTRHLAHRWSYEHNVGPIPDGLSIDHLCRVTYCVNPEHLEPVTHRENVLRGIAPAAEHARKTHCPQGHPYDEANTWVSPRTGWRGCRACNRENQARRWRANNRGATSARLGGHSGAGDDR